VLPSAPLIEMATRSIFVDRFDNVASGEKQYQVDHRIAFAMSSADD
jgi:hypothetical protein